MCRLGCDEARRPHSREILAWGTRPTRTNVLTLDVEDRNLGPRDTVAVFRRVGASFGMPFHAPVPPNRGVVDPGRDPRCRPAGGRAPSNVMVAHRAWYAPLYKYAMETPFTFRSPKAFSCKAKRAAAVNKADLRDEPLHHPAPAPSRSERGDRQRPHCDRETRSSVRQEFAAAAPNFVQVDFATLGDVNGAVDELKPVSAPPVRP